jgi:FAD:protein FMN transferase
VNRRGFLEAFGSGLAASLLPALGLSARPPVRLSARRPLRLIERWSWAMGQPIHLQLFASSEDQGYAAAEAALAELRAVEEHLTRFSDTSDLSELNRHAGRKGTRVGSDLARVLAQSLRFERLTRGAFNAAVEPLMDAWGFRSARRSPPSAAELAEARASVLAASILLNGDKASLPSLDTRLDLGGIGVGYGLDRAVVRLRALGIERAFLDVSGDCFALGAPPGEAGWQVDIAGSHPGAAPLASTRLRDAALATSSNTMSVVRFGRAIRGHVMNPETGWPADALMQVSVLARTGIEADALSTAMLVSGKPFEGVLHFYSA